jgi:uncharacterized protein (DUF2164 family)
MTKQEVNIIIGYLEGLKKYASVPDKLKNQEPYKHRYVYNQAIKDAIEIIKEVFSNLSI